MDRWDHDGITLIMTVAIFSLDVERWWSGGALDNRGTHLGPVYRVKFKLLLLHLSSLATYSVQH